MLSTVALNGSRCVMTAVRNAPIRTVERNIHRIAAVVAKLRVTSQIQFSAECGMFHVCAVNAIAINIAVDDSMEYQVVSRASAPTR